MALKNNNVLGEKLTEQNIFSNIEEIEIPLSNVNQSGQLIITIVNDKDLLDQVRSFIKL